MNIYSEEIFFQLEILENLEDSDCLVPLMNRSSFGHKLDSEKDNSMLGILCSVTINMNQ